MPAYNPGGSEGTSYSQSGLNPDGGGVTGLFSEGADWLSDTVDGLFGTAQSILTGIGNFKLSKLALENQRQQYQNAAQSYTPTSAPAMTTGATGGFAVPANIGSWLMIGGAVILAVWGLPKLLK